MLHRDYSKLVTGVAQKKTCDNLNIPKEYLSLKVWRWLNKKSEPLERAGKKIFLKTLCTKTTLSDLFQLSKEKKKNLASLLKIYQLKLPIFRIHISWKYLKNYFFSIITFHRSDKKIPKTLVIEIIIYMQIKIINSNDS